MALRTSWGPYLEGVWDLRRTHKTYGLHYSLKSLLHSIGHPAYKERRIPVHLK